MRAKKGAKKLVVDGVAYRYKVSRWRRVSDWKPATAGLVDERWLARARALGLGAVADVTMLRRTIPCRRHSSRRRR